MRVEDGERTAASARLAYVSPSHQFPVGVTMSASRRLELLRWAGRSGAWILEDDYDSEFRYRTRPLASFQGMDQDGRVVYIGTFSKTLAPALRLGYLIVPEEVAPVFRVARAASDRHSPVLEQAVLADFLAEGHFARHVRRMRGVYAERQDALVGAVKSLLGGVMEVGPTGAGMHLTAWLERGADDGAVSAQLAAAGRGSPTDLALCAGSACPGRPPARLGRLLARGDQDLGGTDGEGASLIAGSGSLGSARRSSDPPLPFQISAVSFQAPLGCRLRQRTYWPESASSSSVGGRWYRPTRYATLPSTSSRRVLTSRPVSVPSRQNSPMASRPWIGSWSGGSRTASSA